MIFLQVRFLYKATYRAQSRRFVRNSYPVEKEHFLAQIGILQLSLKMWKIFLVLAFLLSSCSPSSSREYQLEGEDIAKAILKRLERVQSAGDLVREGPKLKKDYAKLVQVMIAAREYQERCPLEEVALQPRMEVSDALKREFMRVYQLEGCHELMEALQRESLHKLDLHQKRLEAKKTQTFR